MLPRLDQLDYLVVRQYPSLRSDSAPWPLPSHPGPSDPWGLDTGDSIQYIQDMLMIKKVLIRNDDPRR